MARKQSNIKKEKTKDEAKDFIINQIQEQDKQGEVEEEKSETVKEDNNETLSLLLEKIKSQEEETKRILSELDELKSQKTTEPSITLQDQERKFGTSTRRELPPNDRLEKPVTFLMRGRGFILSVYMKDGSEIYSPYNRSIRFSHTSSDVRRSGSSEETMHFSSYHTWSKAEAEFIRNSPYYNRLIFESITKVMNVNPMIQSAMQQATSYVETMTDDMLLNNAENYGIDKRQTVSKIKEQLVSIRLQEILEQEEYFESGLKSRVSDTSVPE